MLSLCTDSGEAGGPQRGVASPEAETVEEKGSQSQPYLRSGPYRQGGGGSAAQVPLFANRWHHDGKTPSTVSESETSHRAGDIVLVEHKTGVLRQPTMSTTDAVPGISLCVIQRDEMMLPVHGSAPW